MERFITLEESLVDDAGNALPCTEHIKTGHPYVTAQVAVRGKQGIIFTGALTSGTNNFGDPNAHKYPDLNGIVAIEPTNDRVIVNRHREGEGCHTALVEAGATFKQANQAVREALGPEFWIPIDLTTVESAKAGAVFATGGMGPIRVRPSEITRKIELTDGHKLKTLTGDDIEGHEGLIGLTGGITEMEVAIFRRPPNKFGFSAALADTQQNSQLWVERIASALAGLRDFTNLKFEHGKISSSAGETYVDGVELVTREDLMLILKRSGSDQIKGDARRLLAQMDRSGSDHTLYITGHSPQTFDDLPTEFVDVLMGIDGSPEAAHDAGKLEQMRLLREEIPELARGLTRRKITPDFPYGYCTDVNVRVKNPTELSPDELIDAYRKLFMPFSQYECALKRLHIAAESVDTDLNSYSYGHFHPRNIDPHTRVTLTPAEDSDDSDHYVLTVIEAIKTCSEKLLRRLQSVVEKDPRMQLSYPEKGKIPGWKLLDPKTQETSRQLILQAGRNFNFRAPNGIQI